MISTNEAFAEFMRLVEQEDQEHVWIEPTRMCIDENELNIEWHASEYSWWVAVHVDTKKCQVLEHFREGESDGNRWERSFEYYSNSWKELDEYQKRTFVTEVLDFIKRFKDKLLEQECYE